MSAIQNWLSGPMEYEAGRLLYEQFGRNSVLKRTLSHGPTMYNRSALREELTKLAGTATGPAPHSAKIPAATPVHQPPAPARDILVALEKQWKPLYKEAAYLQSQLASAKDNTQRCQMAHAILTKMERVQELWDTSAYVEEHGHLPPVAEVVPPAVLDLSDAVAVLKRRNNLRAQISKQKRNADRAAEVAAWETELVTLDTALKTLKK